MARYVVKDLKMLKAAHTSGSLSTIKQPRKMIDAGTFIRVGGDFYQVVKNCGNAPWDVKIVKKGRTWSLGRKTTMPIESTFEVVYSNNQQA